MITHTPQEHLSTAGFLRLKEVLKLFPVSKSTWWLGIQTGHFPKPVKLSTRITAWRVCDIQKLLTEMARQNELVANDSACNDAAIDGRMPQ